MRLYLARHAQARAADGSYTHQTPLSALGRRQAEALAEALAEASPDALYASPSRRARETAAPLARRTGLDVRLDARLLEFEIAEVADWDPQSGDPQPDWTIWRPGDRGAPGGETLRAFAERVAAAASAISERHAGEAVAIVSHAGATEAILRWAMGLSGEREWRHEFELPNAAIVELLLWPHGRHPDGPPRYARILRAPALDHLPRELRSEG